MVKNQSSLRGKWRQKKIKLYVPVDDKVRVYLQVLKLAEIVYHNHFAFLKEHKDDLISVAVNKAMKMLSSGEYDSSKGTLLNYIYAGMRNDCQNYYTKYIKFSRKDIPTEDFSYLNETKPLYDTVYTFRFHEIYRYVRKFEPRYGDLRKVVYQILHSIESIEIVDVPKDVYNLPDLNLPIRFLKKLKSYLVWKVVDSVIE